MACIAKFGDLNLDEPPQHGARTVQCFEKLQQIGEGTYGQVHMAKDKETGEVVALKRIKMEGERSGFPKTAIREIKILSSLEHENIIKLKEVVIGPDEEERSRINNIYEGWIYMVFEYMDHDLEGLASRPEVKFSVPQIKCYMKQLLKALHYCRSNRVLHRDIKASNLLIDNNGILKLGDFGLARTWEDDHEESLKNCEGSLALTNHVITLWYRAPEVLLGSTSYTSAVDMWSVGCIFGEILLRKSIIQGQDEIDQINKIFCLCGSPDESNWPGVSRLPLYNNLKPNIARNRRLCEVFRNLDERALDLLDRFLTPDPEKRISAQDALDADYFRNEPLPCEPESLPKYESSHEYETKRKREQQRLSKHYQLLGCPPPIGQTIERMLPSKHYQLLGCPPLIGQTIERMLPGVNQPVHGSQRSITTPGRYYRFNPPMSGPQRPIARNPHQPACSSQRLITPTPRHHYELSRADGPWPRLDINLGDKYSPILYQLDESSPSVGQSTSLTSGSQGDTSSDCGLDTPIYPPGYSTNESSGTGAGPSTTSGSQTPSHDA